MRKKLLPIYVETQYYGKSGAGEYNGEVRQVKYKLPVIQRYYFTRKMLDHLYERKKDERGNPLYLKVRERDKIGRMRTTLRALWWKKPSRDKVAGIPTTIVKRVRPKIFRDEYRKLALMRAKVTTYDFPVPNDPIFEVYYLPSMASEEERRMFPMACDNNPLLEYFAAVLKDFAWRHPKAVFFRIECRYDGYSNDNENLGSFRTGGELHTDLDKVLGTFITNLDSSIASGESGDWGKVRSLLVTVWDEKDIYDNEGYETRIEQMNTPYSPIQRQPASLKEFV
jgi:hypothetical protein